MNRPAALALAVFASLTLAAFVLGGAALGPDRALLPALGALADGLPGHPLILALSAGLASSALFLGIQPIQDPGKSDNNDNLEHNDGPERLPLTEAALLVSASFSTLFLAYVGIGVAAGWGLKTLGLLFVAAVVECTLAIALGIIASLKRPRARRLYALGGALTALDLAALAAVLVFMQG